ncbi:MAG: ion channel [Pseudomonadota bacterium]
MIAAVSIGLALVVLCGGVHYVAMITLHDLIARLSMNRAAKAQLALVGLSVAHLIEAGVYALGFRLGEGVGLGGFDGAMSSDAMSTFYFSLVNYTSLGLGDIYPTGHLRFLAGLESLNGFLLISCSAAMLYLIATERSQPEVRNAS